MTQEKTKAERLRYCVDHSLDCVMLNMTKFRLIYWLFILVISTLYVIFNWAEVTTFTFFTKFDGKNIIFLFWVILLLAPLITSLKIFDSEIALLGKSEQEHAELVEKRNKEINDKENQLDKARDVFLQQLSNAEKNKGDTNE